MAEQDLLFLVRARTYPPNVVYCSLSAIYREGEGKSPLIALDSSGVISSKRCTALKNEDRTKM